MHSEAWNAQNQQNQQINICQIGEPGLPLLFILMNVNIFEFKVTTY